MAGDDPFNATAKGLLVKVRGRPDAFHTAVRNAMGADAVTIEPVMTVPGPGVSGPGFDADASATWFRLGKAADATPWDDAHAMLTGEAFGLSRALPIEAVEPDFEQGWPQDHAPAGPAVAPAAGVCAFSDQTSKGGRPRGNGPGWNFADAFAETTSARASFGANLKQDLARVVVAHLDTGYDPGHITLPPGLDTALQRSFVPGDVAASAVDTIPPGQGGIANRGHGTATLALLAGNRLQGNSPGWGGYADFIGAAPHVRVIPIRIADWVVRFSTGTMVKGFDYARQNHAHVLSMSMGGLASIALTDAVNGAYDAGMVMVTAAGNHFSGVPVPPNTIVFPARFRRVLAACGVMADGHAYFGLGGGTMQGNFGPPKKMPTALAAYTPNVPWAKLGCGNVVDMDGGGTSAATPQIAAAAALWLARHWDAIQAYPEPWMRVEAVRAALFASAAKTTPALDAAKVRGMLGQGVLKMNAALAVQPPQAAVLTKLPPAQPSWSWLDLLTGSGVSLAPPDRTARARQAMLALELTQMEQRHPEVCAALADPDQPDQVIPNAYRYLEQALEHGNPSKPLRSALERFLGHKPRPVRATRWTRREPAWPNRRLRVYALDPSVAKSLDFVEVNQTTLSLRWEDLAPGPVGEYLEVVDVDPASDRFYDPVDLDKPALLAQDGLAPSEGDPHFHQQMVYAVGMTTIAHFEKALGRPALWAPRQAKDDPGGKDPIFVPRLRIYPHALRAENAYYSPAKKALLFGYFPAASSLEDATAPGTLVFSCLSSDIIAHEMSHALLDGLHRHFEESSNPDVPAFHEGFADIVALFQHFNQPDLVRFAVARARGRLSSDKLLAGLARQFGEGTGQKGPLRNYTSPDRSTLSYATTFEVHARGSILVFAVYDAFLRIVERRTADLIRLATGGSGLLPRGALPPDLVERISDETAKAARHVLHICIRALDYCPSVDITFGDYLRALITADRDLVPDDPLNYRVAFMESFRKRGILPSGVRTVSEESIAWSTLSEPRPKWLKRLTGKLDLGWDRALHNDRRALARLSEDNRWKVWEVLQDEFGKKGGSDLMAQLGLADKIPRYNEQGEITGPPRGRTTFNVAGVRTTRRIGPDGSFRTEVIATIEQRRRVPLDEADPSKGSFWFRGGATLILDTRRIDPETGKLEPEIRYVIVKNCNSAARLAQQRQDAGRFYLSPLRGLYFGGEAAEPFALIHAADVGGQGQW